MKNKKMIIGMIFIVILIVLVIGVTYAAFTLSSRGDVVNEISTGTVTMNYENANNGISISNALPTTDEAGKILMDSNQYFDFVVSINITGSQKISYEVTAEKIIDATSEVAGLGNNDVKLYLQRSTDGTNYNEEILEPSHFTPLIETDEFNAGTNEMVLDQGTVNSTTKYYYRFRMWVDKDYQVTDQVKYFTVKVNVYGKDGDIVGSGATKETVSGSTHKGIVYLNPEDLSVKCISSNVTAGSTNSSGCLKWYIYDDSGSTYKMILDHNTTEKVAFNSDNLNTPKEASEALANDTSTWNSNLNPRLITADEVNKIINNTNWDSSDLNVYMVYFDDPPVTSQGESKYAWLFDYTIQCTYSGCDNDGYQSYGYWTSTPKGNTTSIWNVYKMGYITANPANQNYVGIRPVIEIPKSYVK